MSLTNTPLADCNLSQPSTPVQSSLSATATASATDGHCPELADWNAYYQLLRAGQLENYCDRFVVVFNGNVVAAGDDPEQLRQQASEHLGVPGERLVIPFVDRNECNNVE